MSVITLPELRQAVDQAVEDKGGDYIYQYEDHGECVYVAPDGKPSCIIGCALDKLGVLPRYSRAEWNYLPINRAVIPGVELNAEAIRWACVVQDHQDNCEKWGDAVAAANAWLDEG